MAKTKGTTLLSLVKFLASQRERALAVLPAGVHHYLGGERIQPSSWYPEEDLHALLCGMLELLPGDRMQTLEQLGASVAREHLEGVYRHLRSDDIDTLARRSVALWGSQHDTGAFAIEMDGHAAARFEVRDYAAPSREMCTIFRGYFAETLRISGATDVAVEELSCVLRGADACSWAVTWRRPG